MSTVNLYDVLDVPNDATPQQIKEAHRKLILKYHPDKKSGDFEFVEMINHAHSILSNPQKREKYDHTYHLSKTAEKSHFDLRDEARSHYKQQEHTTEKLSEDEMKRIIAQMQSDFDTKHGINRTANSTPIKIEDTDRILDDITQLRIQDDIEYTQDNLFTAQSFSIEKFNAAFDKLRDLGGTELIPHTGNPHAWDGAPMTSLSSNYSTIDNYDNLYIEDALTGTAPIGNAHFSSTTHQLPKTTPKLTPKDLESLQGASYTTGHKFKPPENSDLIDARYKELVQQRSLEFDPSQFKNTIEYGISIDINDDIDDQPSEPIQFNTGVDIKNAYNRLVEIRKKEQTSPDITNLIKELKQPITTFQ